MARSVFDFEGEERVDTPEQLTNYIRIATPGVWAMFAALTLVFVALLIWGFTGRIPDTRTYRGIVDETNGYSVDVVLNASEYPGSSVVGREVTYLLPDGTKGTGAVTQASPQPLSRRELTEILKNDFLSETLIDSEYSYLLTVRPNEDLKAYYLQIADVTIVLNEVPPISFLKN